MSDDPDLSEFLDVRQDVAEPQPRRPHHPSGWEPGVDTAKGVIVAEPSEDPDPPSDWQHILEQFRLDPAKWEVVSDAVNVRTWDANLGRDPDTGEPCVRRLYYYKANVRPRQRGDRADIDALVKRISAHRYRRPDTATTTAGAMVVCLADWQTGPDPDGIVEHVLRLKNTVVDRLKQDRPASLYVIGMGDMIESCSGHYDMQLFAAKLDRREQVKLVRRLLVDLLTCWARYVDKMVVGAVPGNHGEARNGNGKADTTFEDNDDLAVFEQTAEILAANPDAYSHVRFTIPDGDMSLTLGVEGTVVGFIHGHQARRGSTPRTALETWWRGKQSDRQPVGDADVLVAGHRHHLVLVEDGPRTIMQCPALARSRWFREQGGSSTAMGTLTFRAGEGMWDGLEIIR